MDQLRSALVYFTDPVTYTVSSIVRRLSEDQAPTPLAQALSANFNGSVLDATSSPSSSSSAKMSYTPKRHYSPFQPPPLTPLTLEGWRTSTSKKSRLLNTSLAEEIRLLVPPRLQLVDQWSLVYSLEQNGSTLSSLYGLCEGYRDKRGGFVVVVRDAGEGMFGAYLTDAPHPQAQYFGSGECFLWRAIRVPLVSFLANLPPPPSADTTHLGRMTTIHDGERLSRANSAAAVPHAKSNGNGTAGPDLEHSLRFKAFPYTGENDFSIFCDPKYLSVGGGDGHYGLWLNDALSKGVSSPCPTFGNEALSDEGTKFDVLGVELWYIGS